MRNDKTYLFHADAGHGWLQVERQELVDLRIDHIVSIFSFQNNRDVYLEEDCDMPLFVMAYKEKFGYEPRIIDPAIWMIGDYSPIRDFEMYVYLPKIKNNGKITISTLKGA
jgi:hypothetical protein